MSIFSDDAAARSPRGSSRNSRTRTLLLSWKKDTSMHDEPGLTQPQHRNVAIRKTVLHPSTPKFPKTLTTPPCQRSCTTNDHLLEVVGILHMPMLTPELRRQRGRMHGGGGAELVLHVKLAGHQLGHVRHRQIAQVRETMRHGQRREVRHPVGRQGAHRMLRNTRRRLHARRKRGRQGRSGCERRVGTVRRQQMGVAGMLLLLPHGAAPHAGAMSQTMLMR